MSPVLKLAAIGFVVPAVVFAATSVVWSPAFMILAVLGYPIMVAVALICLFPLHKLFASRRIGLLAQLPVVLAAALIGGFSVYVVLFIDAIFDRIAFSSRLAFEYCALGIVAGISTWFFYNFGPLKLSMDRPNSTIERDEPQAARPSS